MGSCGHVPSPVSNTDKFNFDQCSCVSALVLLGYHRAVGPRRPSVSILVLSSLSVLLQSLLRPRKLSRFAPFNAETINQTTPNLLDFRCSSSAGTLFYLYRALKPCAT